MAATFHFNNLQVKLVTAAKCSSTDSISLSSDSGYGGRFWQKVPASVSNVSSINGDIVYGAGKFIIPCVNGNRHIISNDGINWTLSQTASSLGRLAFGNGVFTSLSGNNKTITSISSLDGEKWTISQNKDMKQCSFTGDCFETNTLIYGDSKFVFLSSGYTFSSSNGKDWTKRKNNVNLHRETCFIYDGNRYLVSMGKVDETHCNFKILSSADAFKWNETSASFEANEETQIQIAHGNDVYLALLRNTNSLSANASKVYITKNFADWQLSDINSNLCLNGKLSFGGNQFFVGSYYGLLYSLSGNDWKVSKIAPSNNLAGDTFSNVCFVNGTHVAYTTQPSDILPIYYSKIYNYNEIYAQKLKARYMQTDNIDVTTNVFNSQGSLVGDDLNLKTLRPIKGKFGARTNVIFGGGKNYIGEGLYSSIIAGAGNCLAGKYSSIVCGANASNNGDNSIVFGNSTNLGGSSFVFGENNTNKHNNVAILGTQLTTVSGNLVYVNSLSITDVPKTLPAVKGMVWNDNGTLKIS